MSRWLALVAVFSTWAPAEWTVHEASAEKASSFEVERAWERLERIHGRVAVWAHENCTVFTDLRVARHGVLQVRNMGFLRPPLARHAGCAESTLTVALARLDSAEYISGSASTPAVVVLKCRPEASCGRTALDGHRLAEEALDAREEVPVLANQWAMVFGPRADWGRIGIPAVALPGDATQFVADVNTVLASLPTREASRVEAAATPVEFAPFRRHPVGTRVCRTTPVLLGLLAWREAGVVEVHGPHVPGDQRGRRNTIRVRLDKGGLGWLTGSGSLTAWDEEFKWARCADTGPQ